MDCRRTGRFVRRSVWRTTASTARGCKGASPHRIGSNAILSRRRTGRWRHYWRTIRSMSAQRRVTTSTACGMRGNAWQKNTSSGEAATQSKQVKQESIGDERTVRNRGACFSRVLKNMVLSNGSCKAWPGVVRNYASTWHGWRRQGLDSRHSQRSNFGITCDVVRGSTHN